MEAWTPCGTIAARVSKLDQMSLDQAGLNLPAFDTTAIHCRAAAAAMLATPGD